MSSSSTSAPQGSEIGSAIAPGTVVGGRFAIEQRHAADALGETLLARDQKTNKSIAIRLLAPGFGEQPAAFDTLRNEVRAAAKLKHRSLVGTYGIGTHGRQQFIACEWVHGVSLSEFIRSRQGSPPLSLRGIYNVVAHVCKALSQLHGESCHGALRPSVVFITQSGRVKVGELGLGLALVNTGSWPLLDDESQACLAPEILAGAPASVACDVFGVGALMYMLLTGHPPTQPLAPPSSVHPDGTPALDAVVETCLSPDPNGRYRSVQEVSQALLALVAGTKEPTGIEFGVDLEIDVDVAMSLAPPVAQPGAPRPVMPLAPAPVPARPPQPAAPQPPKPLAAPRMVDPLSVPKPAPATPEPAAVRQSRADDEIAALTAKLTEKDAARWMAVKGGLDHGPFTARELIKLIVDGEVLADHGLLNMTTSERKPLGEWSEFGPFVEQYKLRKAEADHAVALEKSTRIERGGNAVKFVILSASIAALLVVGVGFLLNRQAAKKRAAAEHLDLAAMFESGQVKIKGTAGILQASSRRGARRGGGDNTGFTSYDDAMNQAMDLGDATRGGGERQLRAADVEGVMNRRLNSLFGCVGQELRGGSRLGTVQIDLAILGSGQVAGASVNAGSPAFKRCIAGKVRQISFPSFPAPRMGARYSFGVN